MEKKSELINWLGELHNYNSYLEVATANSGFQFAEIDNQVFSTRDRIMYRLPPNYNDGMAVTCSSLTVESCDCFKHLIDQDKKYDLVFIDSYHTYEASRRDLELALLVLKPTGTLVVHDCNPPSEIYTRPESMQANWTGETFLAFLDFVRETENLDYCVVDMDWGCGVVRWSNPSLAISHVVPTSTGLCRRADSTWPGYSYYQWKIFDQHRNSLLNLKSVAAFKDLYMTNIG